jgi:hypothetical protein
LSGNVANPNFTSTLNLQTIVHSHVLSYLYQKVLNVLGQLHHIVEHLTSIRRTPQYVGQIETLSAISGRQKVSTAHPPIQLTPALRRVWPQLLSHLEVLRLPVRNDPRDLLMLR